MADTYFQVDDALEPGRDLKDALRQLQAAWDRLSRIRMTMIARRNEADGSQAAHYAEHVAAYGYGSQAEAKASFEEIDSNWATVDGKIRQLVARHL